MGIGKKVYIAGKITGDPDYRVKFKALERELQTDGHAVMNPAVMSDGFLYEEYMHVCMAMLAVCEVIFLMPDWKESPGAQREELFARALDKEVVYL